MIRASKKVHLLYYDGLLKEEDCAHGKKLARQYPQFIHLESIGISHDNREILALTMGNPRKVLFCTAGIHGRETINPVILIQIMEEYAHAYQIDLPVPGHPYSIRELLWEYGICFVPLVNPDGYEIASRGFGQIQPEFSLPFLSPPQSGRFSCQ